MSPTSPSFVTLNDQLNKAHDRIRQLEAREVELLARIASAIRANIAASRDDDTDLAGSVSLPSSRSAANRFSADFDVPGTATVRGTMTFDVLCSPELGSSATFGVKSPLPRW